LWLVLVHGAAGTWWCLCTPSWFVGTENAMTIDLITDCSDRVGTRYVLFQQKGFFNINLQSICNIHQSAGGGSWLLGLGTAIATVLVFYQ